MNLFKPLHRTIKSYNLSFLTEDLTSGLTVAVITIPQSIAFAMLANINPIYGLYTAIVGTIIISLFSSSNHVIGGPTNATCLLIASSLAAYSTLSSAEYMFVVFQFTFLIGLFQILFGVFKLGKILNYISHSVIEGFTIGAAILIIFGQANKMVGLSLPDGLLAFEKFFYVFKNIEIWNFYSILLSIIAIFLILITKKIHHLLPGELLSIVITSFLVYLFNLEELGVNLIGKTPVGLPTFKLFPLNISTLIDLTPMALSYSLIALVSAMAIAKTIAKESNEKIDNNNEFITQGISNITSSFFQSFAGTASVSRTALNYYVGAKTRMSGIISGVVIIVFIAFWGNLIAFIPNSTLSAIIIFSAIKMISFREIKQYYKVRSKDFIVASLTLLAVVFFPKLDRAVLFGASISILIYLYESGYADIKILRYVSYKNKLIEVEINELKEKEESITIFLEGNLYFGLAYDLEEKLSILQHKCKNFILRFRSVNSMDMTSYDVIADFTKKVMSQGGKVKLCGLSEKLYKFFERNGYFKLIMEEEVFRKEKELYSSHKKALKKSIEEFEDNVCDIDIEDQIEPFV